MHGAGWVKDELEFERIKILLISAIKFILYTEMLSREILSTDFLHGFLEYVYEDSFSNRQSKLLNR